MVVVSDASGSLEAHDYRSDNANPDFDLAGCQIGASLGNEFSTAKGAERHEGRRNEGKNDGEFHLQI